MENARMRDQNSGMATVEASVLIPIILFLAAGAILLFLTLGKREKLRGDMYVSLYSMTMEEEKEKTARDLLRNWSEMASKGKEGTEGTVFLNGDWLTITSSVPFLKGGGIFSGARKAFSVRAGRERDLCSSRLRRWQIYGNITENEGD